MDTTNNYPYFGEEMLLTQFSLLAESIQKALPPDSQGQNAIAQQLLRINSKKEKWPSRILSLYRNRTLPVFSMEGVTKLNQAHDAFINDVNDTRRRQKDSLNPIQVGLFGPKISEGHKILPRSPNDLIYFLE